MAKKQKSEKKRKEKKNLQQSKTSRCAAVKTRHQTVSLNIRNDIKTRPGVCRSNSSLPIFRPFMFPEIQRNSY